MFDDRGHARYITIVDAQVLASVVLNDPMQPRLLLDLSLGALNPLVRVDVGVGDLEPFEHRLIAWLPVPVPREQALISLLALVVINLNFCRQLRDVFVP